VVAASEASFGEVVSAKASGITVMCFPPHGGYEPTVSGARFGLGFLERVSRDGLRAEFGISIF